MPLNHNQSLLMSVAGFTHKLDKSQIEHIMTKSYGWTELVFNLCNHIWVLFRIITLVYKCWAIFVIFETFGLHENTEF